MRKCESDSKTWLTVNHVEVSFPLFVQGYLLYALIEYFMLCCLRQKCNQTIMKYFLTFKYMKTKI